MKAGVQRVSLDVDLREDVLVHNRLAALIKEVLLLACVRWFSYKPVCAQWWPVVFAVIEPNKTPWRRSSAHIPTLCWCL